MRIAPLIAAAALALSMAAVTAPASAAPALPNMDAGRGLAQTVADWDGPRHHSRGGYDRGDRVDHVTYRHRRHGGHGGLHFYGGGHRWGGGWGQCRARRNECADRWGWGTWRFRRCMARHSC